MGTLSASAAWLIDDRWTLRVSGGAIVGGALRTDTLAIHDVEPGGVAAIGVEYRALVGEGYVPFVDLSMFVSASWADTVAPASNEQISYFATDTRLGARAGWNVMGNAFPYIAVRAFGGPVQWEMDGEAVVGTDIYHYQLALGAAAQIGPAGLFVEWSGLGEKAVSTGVSAAF